MVKRIKKKQKKTEHKTTSSLIMLVIMVLSIGGFAMLGSSNSGSSEDKTQNVPFQEFNYQGQNFWGARINSEEFIFQSIEGYEEKANIAQAAQKIKTAQTLSVFIDKGFVDSNGPFLLEQKIAPAFNIPVQRIQNLSCDSPTVVFSLENSTTQIPDSCIKVISKLGEEANDAQILAYHLVK